MKLVCLVSSIGDYYGIQGKFAQESFQEVLDRLLWVRKDLAYGEQTDYFDDPNCIGWTRSGTEESAPIACLISNNQAATKSHGDWLIIRRPHLL